MKNSLSTTLISNSSFSPCADLSRNNISAVSEDNFKGQQNLLELNLSRNKLDQIPSGTFKYLTVRQSKLRLLMNIIIYCNVFPIIYLQGFTYIEFSR